MRILWAVKKGEPDYYEQVITVQGDKIPQAQAWAEANGFDRFRIAEMPDEPTAPQFGANLLNKGLQA